MEFMRGGELFHHLKSQKRFPESTAKFYAACIISGIGYLHKMGVVYRDLKPENVLLDEKGFIKITDYGLAKYIKPGEVTKSFVGTPEYLGKK
jgi:serum/glucocorticoid-regulated kinase 2